MLKSGVAAALFTTSGDPTIRVLLSIASTALTAVKLADGNNGQVGEEGIGRNIDPVRLVWTLSLALRLLGVVILSRLLLGAKSSFLET